jgi:protein arginine N-methyltransferase 1
VRIRPVRTYSCGALEATLANRHHPSGGLIPAHWHHLMLADERRCIAFRRAIERVVRPGDVVMEAGAGTGLLSFFAATRARAVYAVEADPGVAELGTRLVELNGVADRVTYRQGRAEGTLPPEPVDVVVCEMLHAALAVEQQAPVLNALRGELERAFPGHPFRVIPQEAVSYCQLLEADFTYNGYRAPFVRLGDTYHADPSIRPLSGLVPYHQADFGGLVPPTVDAAVPLTAEAHGRVNAVRLLTQAVLSYDESAPPDERLIDWYVNYVVIPLPEEFEATPGDVFRAALGYRLGCELDEIAVGVTPA